MTAPDPELIPDPIIEPSQIPLERGAVLYLYPKESGAVGWSVRWPTAQDKDPELAAGGYRMGTAASIEQAEADGRAAFAKGPA